MHQLFETSGRTQTGNSGAFIFANAKPCKCPALRGHIYGKISAKSSWIRGIENNEEQQMDLVICINF